MIQLACVATTRNLIKSQRIAFEKENEGAGAAGAGGKPAAGGPSTSGRDDTTAATAAATKPVSNDKVFNVAFEKPRKVNSKRKEYLKKRDEKKKNKKGGAKVCRRTSSHAFRALHCPASFSHRHPGWKF